MVRAYREDSNQRSTLEKNARHYPKITKAKIGWGLDSSGRVPACNPSTANK
jgi:hypothetical protein